MTSYKQDYLAKEMKKQSKFFLHFLLSKSKRNLLEQILGLFTLVSIFLIFYIFSAWISVFDFGYDNFIQLPYFIKNKLYLTGWILYYIFLGCGIWSLWRKFPVKNLKLDMSFSLWQVVLTIIWTIVFVKAKLYLLSFLVILFITSSLLISFVSSWKKEKKYAPLFFFYCLFWLSYISIVNLEFCVLIT